MAIGNESVTVATCDACGKRTYGDPGQKPKVLSGKVRDDTGQEKNAEWSACGPSHIGKAVQEALKKTQPANVSRPEITSWQQAQ